MSTRGLTSANNIVTVDGLMVNGLDGDGAVQQYFNQAMVQEMSYQTSGAGADVSPGGVRMAIVSRDGGNQFNGSFFAGWTQDSFLAVESRSGARGGEVSHLQQSSWQPGHFICPRQRVMVPQSDRGRF
jgi:hypothetical protein